MEQDARIAPSYRVPIERIVAIEHPAIVRNFDRGVESLGGDAQLKHVLEHHVGDSKSSGKKQNSLPEPVAGVSLRPNDPFAKKIASVGIETRNVLVKVTVPKRTGRKRKRGSNDAFVDAVATDAAAPTSITAPDLLQRLRDNQSKYAIEPIAILRETHRFRTLPDFQLRNEDLPMMRELRDHAMVSDYDKIGKFYIDPNPLPQNSVTAFPGPPSFTSTDMPHKYEYQQAAGIVLVHDDQGNLTTKNTAAPTKRHTWGLAPDAKEVPQGPPPDLPQKSQHGEMLPRAIRELEKLLEQRPLVTKRVALNSLPPVSDTIFKEATPFVGYTFKAGPWRDSLIKYGVDPRKDAKYRFYQTMMFQVDSIAFKNNQTIMKSRASGISDHKSRWARPLRHTKDEPTSHIFDGKNITANGKTWQVCDVTDPLIHDIFHTQNIRTECDVYQWGWFHCGTMAKGRVIMKDKIRYLFEGETPPTAPYEAVKNLPDELYGPAVAQAYCDPRFHGRHAADLSHEVRNIVKGGEGSKSARALWQRESRSNYPGRGSVDDGAGNREQSAGAVDDGDDDEQGQEGGGAVDMEDEDDDMGDGDFDQVDDAPEPSPRRKRTRTASLINKNSAVGESDGEANNDDDAE